MTEFSLAFYFVLLLRQLRRKGNGSRQVYSFMKSIQSNPQCIKALALKLLPILAGTILVLWFWRCPFYLLGYSCPGCGMSRALLAALKGRWQTAFAYHPLWPVAIVGGSYLLLRYLFGLKLSARTEKVLGVVVVTVFIGVYIYRLLVLNDPVVAFRR